MNVAERLILALAPGWALSRARARVQAMAYTNAYDAAHPGRLRRGARDYGSGDSVTKAAARPLRDLARHLERNHDIARGILDALVRNVVGPTGIGIEPQPIGADGFTVDVELAAQIQAYLADWWRAPEVTFQMDFGRSQHALARSWFRDGDAFYQMLAGYVPSLDHGTVVPFSIELIESDLVPLDLNDEARRITQGVERNAWGKPLAFHLYKTHPSTPGAAPETKRVSADVVRQIKLVDRIGQARGITMFASVLSRLEDLKDYEESERVAAKIAACLAAVITKGDASTYDGPPEVDAQGRAVPRSFRFEAGMVMDPLGPGEGIETIDTKRPNAQLEPFRNAQLRAIAAGTGVSYSTASRNYNGTYSAQRQELVEQWSAYALLSQAFIDQAVRPIYENFLSAALLSGAIRLPKGRTFRQFASAMYIPPTMPWINPRDEAEANVLLEQHCYRSGPEIIQRMGGRPRDVARQQELWLQLKRECGIPAASPSGAAAPAPIVAADTNLNLPTETA